MTTTNISIPDSAFTLSAHSSNRLENMALYSVDHSYWLYGLAISYAQTNNVAELVKLINQGLDVTFNDGYLLYVAVEYNHKDMVLFLVDKKLDINTVTHDESNLLECAAYHGHFYICETLLKLGADPKSMFHDPISAAAANGYTSICQLLLDFGGPINMSNRHRNPCIKAIMGDHHETLNLLLTNIDGDTDLKFMVFSNIDILSEDCALVMAKHGAHMQYIQLDDFAKIVKAPTRFISKLTPKMPESFIQKSVDLHISKSKRNITYLMDKADDWLQPYYLKTLAKGI
jgi:hypothetical protein